jgi:hypothetical protein
MVNVNEERIVYLCNPSRAGIASLLVYAQSTDFYRLFSLLLYDFFSPLLLSLSVILTFLIMMQHVSFSPNTQPLHHCTVLTQPLHHRIDSFT